MVSVSVACLAEMVMLRLVTCSYSCGRVGQEMFTLFAVWVITKGSVPNNYYILILAEGLTRKRDQFSQWEDEGEEEKDEVPCYIDSQFMISISGSHSRSQMPSLCLPMWQESGV